MRTCLALLAGFLSLWVHSGSAAATASGPDAWDVRGVEAGGVLNMHADPSARSRTIAKIPHDAKGLRNLGCTGGPTFQQWLRMSEAERARSSRSRWCRVAFSGKRGWVSGRFLQEGGAVALESGAGEAVGPWTVKCMPSCVLEQAGIGSTRPTLLRLTPAAGNNAEITIERAGAPRNGTLTVYMDGETISAGPIAPLAAKGAGKLVLDPDDITAGLLKQMGRHKNMVLSFPGEERGVEIHLDRFEEAWRRLGERQKR